MKILKNENISIHAISQFHINKLSNIGISNSKLNLFNNPVNYENQFLNSYNSDSKYFVYAGRIEKDKGVKELLEVFKRDEFKDFIIYIIGRGSQMNELIKTYTYKNIKFLGEVSYDETLNYIKNARAVVTNTRTYEGQPRLLCEASSLAVPSIFPKFGSMVEFFPKPYSLGFDAFDQVSLKNAFLKTFDSGLMKKESENVKKFIFNKLNPTDLLEVFENA